MPVIPADPFSALVPRGERRPGSARILDSWVRQAASELLLASERVSWILATTVVIAVLQRAVGPDGGTLFVLKGGAYIERKLDLASRATKDLDSMFRGSVAEFESALDESIAVPWGEIAISRTAIEVIEAPLIVKPRRFYMLLSLRGKIWRRIKVEVAFPEGSIEHSFERIPSPSLTWFGLDQPSDIVTIAMAYQVAQKIHACSDPHNPPTYENDRVRDVVDLILVRKAFYSNGESLAEVAFACQDIFASRLAEAERQGIAGRTWPPSILTNRMWEKDFNRPATEAGLDMDIATALEAVTEWVAEIAGPTQGG
jgi:hypothetical protein